MAEIKKPIISVVIPVYNVDDWLSECLDSIIHQTLKNIEIICVNDGSTDSSPEILREYAETDDRIRIIDQENRGLSEARNTGVRAASGKYLYFMDSDDVLETKALELCVADMELRNLELLCFNAVAFGKDRNSAKEAGKRNSTYFGRVLNEQKIYSGQELFSELKTAKTYTVPVWTWIILRARFLEHHFWFHAKIFFEDEPWLFSVLMTLSRCGCINQALYHYRIREDSIIHLPPAFSLAYGLFAGLLDEQRFLLDHPDLLCNQQLREIIISHIAGLQKKIIRKYQACSEEERQKRYLLSNDERLLFEQTIVFPSSLMDAMKCQTERETALAEQYYTLEKRLRTDNEKGKALKRKKAELEKKERNLKTEIHSLKSSASYRLGSLLTFIPRKIKGICRTVRAVQTVRKPAMPETQSDQTEGQILQPSPNKIVIFPSEVTENQIIYHYQVSGEWKTCFRADDSFETSYSFSLEDIPESIRIIPFLAEILPVSWIFDAEVETPVCDEDFCDCIEPVKAEFRKKYPRLAFNGRFSASQTEKNEKTAQGQNALVCFSDSIDAVSSAISHLPEKPLLVNFREKDMHPDDEAGRESDEIHIRGIAEQFGLKRTTVRTTFHGLLNGEILSGKIKASGGSQWHGFLHDFAVLGHMAPAVWRKGIRKVYIASSCNAEEQNIHISDPALDNAVRFCGARMVPDGYDLDRQSKIRRITDFSQRKNQPVSLHICRKKPNGDNCCHCEKCWMTILGIYAEGADPKSFGFSLFDGFSRMSDDLERVFFRFRHNAKALYEPIQKRLRERMEGGDMPSELFWFIHADLSRIEDGSLRLHEGKLLSPVWLLGTTDHRDMGDQCTAEEEICFLRAVMPDKCVVEINETQLRKRKFSQLKQISPSQMVLLHGGGDPSAIRPEQEQFRKEILSRLNNNPVIVFTQSIRPEESMEARKVYQGDRLLLCCRDPMSYKTAQSNFSCRTILVPDMMLWEKKGPKRVSERFGAMLMLRDSRERKWTESDIERIEDYLAVRFHSVEASEMIYKSGKVTKKNRTEKINRLLFRIASVECVVTDQLYGIILCAVTGTPCVALSKSCLGMEAGCEWIRDLEYIRFIHDIAELETAIDYVCSCTDREYPEKKIREQFLGLVQYLENQGGDGIQSVQSGPADMKKLRLVR